MKKKPTKLTKFSIDELSFVDSPANAQCKITILKRADSEVPTDAVPVIKSQIGVPFRPLDESAGVREVVLATPDTATPAPAPTQSKSPTTTTTEAFVKAEHALDALVAKRLERYPDESEPTAMVRILETKEGKRCYAQMCYAQDIAVAKTSTLLTYDVSKAATLGASAINAAPDLNAATAALRQLDKMARDRSSATGQTFYVAYAAILATDVGRKLYNVAMAAPSTAAVGAEA